MNPFAAFAPPIATPTPLRRAITAAYRRPEAESVGALLGPATLPPDLAEATRATARRLIAALRAKKRRSGVEALVKEYALSS